MPIYEYKCSTCGNEQENLVRTGTDSPVCENCGGNTLNRKLSVFAVSGSTQPAPSSHGDCACAAAGGGGCGGAGYSSGGCGCGGH